MRKMASLYTIPPSLNHATDSVFNKINDQNSRQKGKEEEKGKEATKLIVIAEEMKNKKKKKTDEIGQMARQ